MNSIDTELVRRALDVVRASGDIVRDHWAKPRNVCLKGRIDLVTDTDTAVERFLKEHLAPLLPDATFLAEESATATEPHGMCWIIDPVDGTTNFAHAVPLVATSVGLWDGKRIVLGIVNIPMLDECYWAVRGEGAWLNGQRLCVSGREPVEQALVATGFPYAIQEKVDEVIGRLRRVLVTARGVRRCGAAAVDLAFVAAGRYDAFYEDDLKPWDTAAGWLLVEEAGGLVTTFDGGGYAFGRPVLATNALVHQEMIRLLDVQA